jgi:nucleoside-diphosphate-sugar epimerase
MDWTRDLHGVTPVPGSVLDRRTWLDGPRTARLAGIFHLAALVRHSRRHADEVYHANVDGTLEMVRAAAARGCRLIFASTSGTVGCFRTPGQAADEEAPYCEAEVARWPYYHSKVVAEQRARALAAELGVDLVIVRPPVLLGPGDHRFRSTGHLIRYLQRRLPFLVRGGMHFADVRDTATAFARAAKHAAPRPVYHLPGLACGIEDFFAMAEAVCGVPAPERILPYWLAWWIATLFKPLGVLPDPVVVELASHYWGTTSRYAASDLGYRSRDPHETLADTITWLRTHHPALRARHGMTEPAPERVG